MKKRTGRAPSGTAPAGKPAKATPKPAARSSSPSKRAPRSKSAPGAKRAAASKPAARSSSPSKRSPRSPAAPGAKRAAASKPAARSPSPSKRSPRSPAAPGAKRAAAPKRAPRRAPPSKLPARSSTSRALSEPYAVRIARRGGAAEARPLERSGAMAFPLGAHLGPPDFLDEIAAAEWRRIAELQGRFAEKGLSWISEVDLAAVTAYCAAWSIWCRAARGLMSAGDFIDEDEKGRRRPRAEIRVERDARAGLLLVAKELGLTSMIRSRIQAQMYAGEISDDDDGLLA